MPAAVIVDRTGIARFVHYSHDMSDIPENQELLGLLDQLNAFNGDAKMSLIMILKVIACVLTAATGLLALVKPTAVYGFTGLNAGGARGISEIRAIFGGLFIALGIAPLILGGVAYQMLGIGYLVIAVARLVSIFIDRSTASSNLISLAIEIACGVILILR